METRLLDEQLTDFFESVSSTANVCLETQNDIHTAATGRLWEMFEKMQQAYGMVWGAKALAERIGWGEKAHLMSRLCFLLEARIQRVKRELRIRGVL